MKNTKLLGLCLGASVVFATQIVYADPGNGPEQRSARAVQVQIDKETGKKVTPGNFDLSHQAAVPVVGTAFMPAKSSEPVHHANGTVSAQLGMEHMKYLVMTIDENGKRSVSHQSAISVDSKDIHAHPNAEEK